VQLLRTGRWAAALTALFLSSQAQSQNVQFCASCHGPDGNSVIAGTPSIAGQPKTFLENQLIMFREELRKSPAMQPVVRGMKDAEIVKLAEHYSKLPAKSMAEGPGDPKLTKRGAELARKLHCGSCHVKDFRGQNQMPRLAGQREDYLLQELLAYRDNKRPDTTMSAAIYGVTEPDLKALAHFLSRRGSARSPAR
jgi:cytochrome c553